MNNDEHNILDTVHIIELKAQINKTSNRSNDDSKIQLSEFIGK